MYCVDLNTQDKQEDKNMNLWSLQAWCFEGLCDPQFSTCKNVGFM